MVPPPGIQDQSGLQQDPDRQPCLVVVTLLLVRQQGAFFLFLLVVVVVVVMMMMIAVAVVVAVLLDVPATCNIFPREGSAQTTAPAATLK